MAVFLFVTASVAVLAGLVGLVAAHMPQTAGQQQAHPRPCPRGSGAPWQGGTAG